MTATKTDGTSVGHVDRRSTTSPDQQEAEIEAKIERALDESFNSLPGAYYAIGGQQNQHSSISNNNSRTTTITQFSVEEQRETGDDNEGSRSSTDEQGTKQKQRRLVGLALVLALVIVAVVLCVSLLKQNGSNNDEIENYQVVTSAALLDRLQDVLPNSTKEAILGQVEGSYQLQAWEWLLQDEQLSARTTERTIQRFALACMYFATNGDTDWLTNAGWLDYNSHECTWYPYQSRSMIICSEENPDDDFQVYRGLHLIDNGLKGSLPEEISLLTSLMHLDLSQNMGLAAAPAIVMSQKMQALKSIEFSETSISGSVPTQIGLLTNLEAFSLESASLITGTIPTQIGQLTRLQILNFAGTSIRGTIPTEMGRLTNLFFMSNVDTMLSGTVPSELATLTALKTPLLAFPESNVELHPDCVFFANEFMFVCRVHEDEDDPYNNTNT